MSSRSSPSWASVVAYGIIGEREPSLGEPLEKQLEQPLEQQLEQTVSGTPMPAFISETPTPSPSPTLTPMSTPTATPTLTPMSTPPPMSPMSPMLSPRYSPTPTPTLTLDDIEKVQTTLPAPQLKSPTPAPTQRATYCPSGGLQYHSDYRRPFRSIWPRQAIPFTDRRPHHRANARGNVYRPRRHPYNLVQMHPRGPPPLAWQRRGPRPMMKPLFVDYGNFLDRGKCQGPTYYHPSMQMPPPPVEPTYQYHTPNFEWKPPPIIHNESVPQDHRNSAIYDNMDFHYKNKPQKSPGFVPTTPRQRCQITSGSTVYDTVPWKPVGNCSRVWEPLDMNQRTLDPSNPMPLPPPGFEHVVLGKRSLSNRALQLMGEPLNYRDRNDYPTPQPMAMPERELRDQQHFIAGFDTHLTCRSAQLLVTNGAIGDGYYVRPVSKLMPKAAKVVIPPKYKPLFNPNVSYWDLLRRNQEKSNVDDGEITSSVFYRNKNLSQSKGL